ncbi:MAG TPA: LptA/OstA family protein, partial [Gemmatimonadaceae bacterium]|nr:LptA/OstA family protein [Gemmatimonadaceae bacterium]
MARETWILGPLFAAALCFTAKAHADDADCPKPAGAESAIAPILPAGASATDGRVEIEADDGTLNVNGSSVLSGNVVMRLGDKLIRADHLEYDAQNGNARLDGAVEFSTPALKVRGSNGTYSPALGGQFEGTQFELPASNARGAAGSMQVEADGTTTLEDVSLTTCPVTDVAWQLNSKRIVIDPRSNNGTGSGTSVEFKGVPV